MSYKTYTKEHFKPIAPWYDLSTFFLYKVRKKVVEISGIRKGKVLDICTGTGSQALAFAEKGFQVIGIDLSPDMIDVAQRKNKKKNHNVKFIVGDAAKLPFKNNSFDICVISFGLHEMPDKIRGKVLDDMKRVAKNNIIIVDFSTEKTCWFVKLFESKYYPSFIKKPMKKRLAEQNIRIIKKYKFLFGYCNILLCK